MARVICCLVRAVGLRGFFVDVLAVVGLISLASVTLYLREIVCVFMKVPLWRRRSRAASRPPLADLRIMRVASAFAFRVPLLPRTTYCHGVSQQPMSFRSFRLWSRTLRITIFRAPP